MPKSLIKMNTFVIVNAQQQQLVIMVVPLGFFFLFSLTLISIHSTPSHSHASFSQQSHIKLLSDTSLKQTHLHFYLHEIRTENNPSIVQIVNAPENVPNWFGTTFAMDDALTEEPDMSSKHVGRAQGLFGLASRQDLGMFMLINFAFTEGDFAGSTLSMLGRNPVSEQSREMPIVGGTGVFTFATGYAIAHSLYSISTPEHFVVEYNITVRH